MTRAVVPKVDSESGVSQKVAQLVLDFLGTIPESNEHKISDPKKRAQSIASAAAIKAAVVSGALAIPPGPIGLLTIVPDLYEVWKIQAKMVADIAAAYGKSDLTREQMIYCLFRHVAAQAVRDLVVRVGERFLVRRVSLRVFQSIAKKIGYRVTQRAIGKGVSRWLPIVGAVGVGAYAYYDTAQVAVTAIELFGRDIEVENTTDKSLDS
jgi:hypothetical protein